MESRSENTSRGISYRCRRAQLTPESWYNDKKAALQNLEVTELCMVNMSPLDRHFVWGHTSATYQAKRDKRVYRVLYLFIVK